jgi:hypothetical protein
VLAASIIKVIITLMMEAASTSETSVNFYQTTWCNNPEDSHLLIFLCFYVRLTLLHENRGFKPLYNRTAGQTLTLGLTV